MSSPTDEEREAARKRLTEVLPFMRFVVSQSGRVPHLGAVALNADGSGGVVTAYWEAGSFLDDIALAAGLPPETEEQRIEARAHWLQCLFGGGDENSSGSVH